RPAERAARPRAARAAPDDATVRGEQEEHPAGHGDPAAPAPALADDQLRAQTRGGGRELGAGGLARRRKRREHLALDLGEPRGAVPRHPASLERLNQPAALAGRDLTGAARAHARGERGGRSLRRRLPSATGAGSTAATEGPAMRAPAARNTEAGSVAWSPTRSAAIAATSSVRAGGASL